MNNKKEAIEILESLVKCIKDSGHIPQGVGEIKDNTFYLDIETTLKRHIIIKLDVDVIQK